MTGNTRTDWVNETVKCQSTMTKEVSRQQQRLDRVKQSELMKREKASSAVISEEKNVAMQGKWISERQPVTRGRCSERGRGSGRREGRSWHFCDVKKSGRKGGQNEAMLLSAPTRLMCHGEGGN
jgi:hypothetical protein